MKVSRQLTIIFALCFCTFFAHLGEFAPDLMEARNFITAREMIQDGHWGFPTMNEAPRLEKPPLPTWLTAVSALVGGLDSPFAMRFPAALVGLFMVFAFFRLCGELSRDRYFQLIGGIVMATSLLVIQLTRTNSWDIYAHAFMVGSIWQLLRFWNLRRNSNLVGAILFMALSVMSKGPIAPYTMWLPFILAYGYGYGWKMVAKEWKSIAIVVVAGLFLGFGWNIYTYVMAPEISEYVVNKETNSWGARHVRPFYFYGHFAVYVGIWAVFVIGSFFWKYGKPTVDLFGKYKFVLAWMLLSILFLSVVPTKKERYLLPAIVPMVLMAAYMYRGLLQRFTTEQALKGDRLILRIFGTVVGLGCMAVPIIGWMNREVIDFSWLSFLGMAAMPFLGLFIIKPAWTNQSFSVLIRSAAAVAVICLTLTPEISDFYYKYPEFKDVAEVQTYAELEGVPYFITGSAPNMKLVWAAGKPVKEVRLDSLAVGKDLPVALFGYGNKFDEWVDQRSDSCEVTNYGVFDYFRKDSKYKIKVYLLQ